MNKGLTEDLVSRSAVGPVAAYATKYRLMREKYILLLQQGSFFGRPSFMRTMSGTSSGYVS